MDTWDQEDRKQGPCSDLLKKTIPIEAGWWKLTAKKRYRTGEMAQKVTASAVKPDDLSWIPSDGRREQIPMSAHHCTGTPTHIHIQNK